MIARKFMWSRRKSWLCLKRSSIIVVFTMCCAASSLLCQRFQSSSTEETSVKIHTEDAHATLAALRKPNLTSEEALSVARMPGNRGVVRKLQEFGIASTTESFAKALYASAHGIRVTSLSELAIGFDQVKPRSQEILALLDMIDADPRTFKGAIEDRIRMFTPANADIHLDGYVVAAGDGAGYAFGGTDFFLNIGVADDMLVAKSTTIHELYHAVQGAYVADRERRFGNTEVPAEIACENQLRLFESLYEEGTARFVEDTTLLAQSKSESASRILTDFNDAIKHATNGVALLDMSVDALQAINSLSFEDVYEVGFLGHGLLYGIGYMMARDIANDSGREAIIELLKEPSYMFVLRYTRLAKYGIDDDHPKLKKNTVAAARRLAAGCK